ncbi:sugar transporter SWEET1-like [Mya arenaria]|uniref:sugar transporter SWEET1-like n=1 Tax=Mya arenaria TaxID=6604 RepID=UPI0022E193F9|nr:sugar transporter SWEET1-like [Mya arenaria]XP_052814465.1 sugar transporter SWEET1-like [Mya arenaria]XP_052814467.1 sugar transporter SWEET1-like [Mya arenaria]XP_052814468.1 sugar transporter SWEET1-like [Mya arenaria]XP_052814469.1 sugar transporter SWEET1-like [Mya arenaria]
MELLFAVEAFTQVITYLMIVAGVSPVLSMLRSGDTSGVPYPFFLAGLVNSVMSIGYGLLADHSTILQINVIATAFNIFYVASYIIVSKRKSSAFGQFISCCLVVACVYFYVTRVARAETRMDNIGVILLTWCTVLQITPLLDVKECMARQSAGSLSLVMMFAGTLCCSCWFLYGFLLKDFYIYAPNVVGVFSYGCQMAAIAVYGRQPIKTRID